jgi:hypothetical protein
VAFVFRFNPGLESLSGLFLLPQELFNAGKSAARGSGARGDGCFGAVEVVPGQGLDVGPEYEVGIAFPDFELVLLCCVHGPAHDLKNICGRAVVAILNAYGNTDYRSSTEVASGARRNRGDEATIRKTARADLHRLEQAWEGTTRADGVHKIALCENHRFAGSQVRGHYRKRYAEIFKLARIENAFDQILKTLITCQAEPGNAPTGDVPEAERAASLHDARKRRATGIGGAEDTAHAGSRDVRDGDVVLFEDLQNAYVREAARETSAKGEADACPAGHGGCTLVQGLGRRAPMRSHARRIAGCTAFSYGSSVPKEQYFCTLLKSLPDLLPRV